MSITLKTTYSDKEVCLVTIFFIKNDMASIIRAIFSLKRVRQVLEITFWTPKDEL